MIFFDNPCIPLISSALITFCIGSNDTSNSLGICIGCGIIPFRRAIALFSLLALAGIFFQGRKIMQTVGKDLLAIDSGMLSIALIVSAGIILTANWRRLPISTHQAIIGSLTGAGIATGSEVNLESLLTVVASWFISPVAALGASFAIYWLMEKTISRLPLLQIERIISLLLVLSGFVVAYTTGANELATIWGPVIHSGLLRETPACLIGSAMLSLGAWLLSRRVIETIGKGITALDPYSGFAAQFGAGGCVFLFTLFGMPISTTYCIIGGIAGVGILKGTKTLRMDLLKKISLSCVLTPTAACLAAMAITMLVLHWSP